MYLTKTPDVLKPLYRDLVWQIPTDKKEVFLTFDDGPIPEVTPATLAILEEFDAKATFFCVGDNVVRHPEVFEQVQAEGHAVGHHTMNHLSGWQTENFTYYRNVLRGAKVVNSPLFRPPYGKVSRQQAQVLKDHFQIVMWDVLSGDFDPKVSREQCLANVIKHTEAGSIIVFHDSIKAAERMLWALPRVLEHFSAEGYTFSALKAN